MVLSFAQTSETIPSLLPQRMATTAKPGDKEGTLWLCKSHVISLKLMAEKESCAFQIWKPPQAQGIECIVMLEQLGVAAWDNSQVQVLFL